MSSDGHSEIGPCACLAGGRKGSMAGVLGGAPGGPGDCPKVIVPRTARIIASMTRAVADRKNGQVAIRYIPCSNLVLDEPKALACLVVVLVLHCVSRRRRKKLSKCRGKCRPCPYPDPRGGGV